MKVIFNQDNRVETVAWGHAVNYLFPQNIARPYTRQEAVKLKQQKQAAKKKKAVKQAKLGTIRGKLSSVKTIQVKAKVDKRGHLFGSVSDKQIKAKLDLTKSEQSKLELSYPKITKPGTYPLSMKVGKDKLSCKLVVEPEDEAKT